jgi:Cys-tRNA(Pro)/Cys-tRNA(Cys) deacylase
MKKTQAMRALDARGIAYRAVEYDASGSFHSGVEAAALVGAAPDVVFKTLVVLREGASSGRPLLVIVPVADEVDLKLLAQAVGAKKLRMATQREAERMTGMQVGGISALGVPAGRFEVLIDERARALETIHVSAGARGVDLELAVADLVSFTAAQFVRAAG